MAAKVNRFAAMDIQNEVATDSEPTDRCTDRQAGWQRELETKVQRHCDKIDLSTA
jgi:hypothetical protein